MPSRQQNKRKSTKEDGKQVYVGERLQEDIQNCSLDTKKRFRLMQERYYNTCHFATSTLKFQCVKTYSCGTINILLLQKMYQEDLERVPLELIIFL